jgi:hypothetical protein
MIVGMNSKTSDRELLHERLIASCMFTHTVSNIDEGTGVGQGGAAINSKKLATWILVFKNLQRWFRKRH